MTTRDIRDVPIYHVEKTDKGYVVKSSKGKKTHGPNKSHLAVIKEFRGDPDYGEAPALTTEYEGDE